jgi:hypothetical protein
MFRSLLYDHPQGLSFVLSAFTNFPAACFVICLFGMWQYAVCNAIYALQNNSTVFIYQDMNELKTYDGRISLTYVYVFPVYLSVGRLVVNCILLCVVAARAHMSSRSYHTY